MASECVAARQWLSARLDQVPLAPDAEGQLAAHLATCAACRSFAEELRVQEQAVRELWVVSPVPPDFAARTIAALPPRRRLVPWLRYASVAAALLVALVSLLLIGGGDVRAGVDLLLRRVGLREAPPPGSLVTVPLREVTLAEAQQAVPWAVRLPDPVPAGYQLTSVAVGAGYQFANGPTIFLFYTRAGATVPQLVITQFRAADSSTVIAPIAPDAGQRVMVGTREGLLIEGLWVERGGAQVWERGTLLRLIIEDETQVIQFEADPAAGWDASRLIALAEQLR